MCLAIPAKVVELRPDEQAVAHRLGGLNSPAPAEDRKALEEGLLS